MTTQPSNDKADANEIALLVLGKNQSEIDDFCKACPHVEGQCRLVLVANPNKKHGGYAAIANPFVQKATETVVGVVHADTRFDEEAIPILAGAAKQRVISGLVGRRRDTQVWGRTGGGFVSTLDSCSVFFRRDLGLRFDGKMFDDFHCLVEDLCLQALSIGVRSFVPAVKANHIGELDRPDNWLPNYWRYRDKLGKKWAHIEFWTT